VVVGVEVEAAIGGEAQGGQGGDGLADGGGLELRVRRGGQRVAGGTDAVGLDPGDFALIDKGQAEGRAG